MNQILLSAKFKHKSRSNWGLYVKVLLICQIIFLKFYFTNILKKIILRKIF